MKRILALVLALLTAASVYVIPVSASGANVVTNGLVAHYDGVNNIVTGHDAQTALWKDVAGKHDFKLELSSANYWKDNALHVDGAYFFFPSAVVDTVNGMAFTVEIALGKIELHGTSYDTFIFSPNDNFSLFRRTGGDYIEFKGNSDSSDRVKVEGGYDLMNDSTVTVTSSVGGDVIIYIDGVEIGTKPHNGRESIGADSLALGHTDPKRYWSGDVYSIRFYNRELSAAEVAQNAASDNARYRGKVVETTKAPETTQAPETAQPPVTAPPVAVITPSGADVVTGGLVTHYDAVHNAANGHDAQSAFWMDSAGNNDFSLTLDEANYWKERALHVDGAFFYFPQAVVDLLNREKFTFEIVFGKIDLLGTSYNTFVFSDNDNFSLFRRFDGDILEFKANNSGADRLTDAGGAAAMNNSTITVTFSLGDGMELYRNGELIGTKPAAKKIGANTLALGHSDPKRYWTGDVHSIRFYDRVLTAEEIAQNANADNVKYRNEVLEMTAAEVTEARETAKRPAAAALPETTSSGFAVGIILACVVVAAFVFVFALDKKKTR